MSITTKWLYPPNWDGNYPTAHGFKSGTILMTAEGETSAETDSTKVALSTLKTVLGDPVTKIAVDLIQYDIGGFSQIELFFDDSERTPIATLSGWGKIDFTKQGGNVSPMLAPEDGYSGDIMLTSTILDGLTGSYSISMKLRPKGKGTR